MRFKPTVVHALSFVAALGLSGLAAAQSNELFALNDEFENAGTAANWTRRHVAEGLGFDPLEEWSIGAAAHPGVLRMVPHTVSWYEGYKGPLISKLVDGDFALTTHVRVASRNGAGLPTARYSLAGLMLRAPTTQLMQPEDYVFLSLGYGDAAAWPAAGPGPHFEVKTTDNGQSTLEVTAANVFEVDLQLARVGATVVTLYRRPGEDWTVHRRFARGDLPTTLQAGFVTYTDWDKVETYTPSFHNVTLLAPPIPGDPSTNLALPFHPDLVAEFEFARFQRVVVPPGVDPATASDVELLTFLGDAANSTQANYCTGSTTSNGCVGELTGAGVASATSGSGYALAVANVDGLRTGLIFYGVAGASAAPWGSSGLLCVKAPTQRTGAQTSGGSLGGCDRGFALDWNAFVASHSAALGAPFGGGETVWAQAWWRDPPSTKTTALSNALAFVVQP